MEGTAGAAAAIIERAPWQPGSHRESRGGPSSLPLERVAQCPQDMHLGQLWTVYRYDIVHEI